MTGDYQPSQEPLGFHRLRPWLSRLLATAMLVAVYRLGMSIPLPGTLDVWRLLDTAVRTGVSNGTDDLFRLSLFGLGIMPYISASIILLLLSGFFPGLRRLRDADGAKHAPFSRALLALTCGLALIQGFGSAIFCENLRAENLLSAPDAAPAARALITLTAAAGVLLAVWIAHGISRHGLGNGVAVLFLSTWGADLLERAQATFASPRPDAASSLVATGLFLAGLLLAVLLVTARRSFTLVGAKPAGSGTDGVSDPSQTVLRLQPSGSTPLGAASVLETYVLTLIALLAPQIDPRSLLPGPAVAVLIPVLTIFLSLLFTSWIFNSRDLVERLRRHGLHPADAEGRMLDRADLERAQEKMAWFGAALLCLYAVLSVCISLSESLAPRLAGLVDESLILGVAAMLQITSNLRAWRKSAAGPGSWTRAAHFEVGLDVRLAQRALQAAGIPAIVHDSGPGVLTGSPAPWGECRPYYPSLVVYGRLAGGQVEVWVPSDKVEAARQLLEQWEQPTS